MSRSILDSGADDLDLENETFINAGLVPVREVPSNHRDVALVIELCPYQFSVF